MQKTISYLSCWFLFKVAVGAILLLIGWDSIGISGNGSANIAITMGLSFLPAAFAKPLFKKFSDIPIHKVLTFSLIICSILIITEHFLIRKFLYVFFIIHFILWIFIFIVEVGCEKWYVAISQSHTLSRIRKLSGISTGVGQLGIIFGPLVVMWCKAQNQTLPYWIISAIFLCASLFSFFTLLYSNIENTKRIISTSIQVSNLNTKIFYYTLALSLIWPTLTIFNMSIPLLAKSPLYNSINVAGILEILIALATALAGFSHTYITSFGSFKTRTSIVFLILIIATITSYLYDSNFILLSFGIFFLGISYGYFRVELRTYLSKNFPPDIAGDIIATANSWSGPLVILYALIFYFETKLESVNHLTLIFPLSFLICALVFFYILNMDKQSEMECYDLSN